LSRVTAEAKAAANVFSIVAEILGDGDVAVDVEPETVTGDDGRRIDENIIVNFKLNGLSRSGANGAERKARAARRHLDRAASWGRAARQGAGN